MFIYYFLDYGIFARLIVFADPFSTGPLSSSPTIPLFNFNQVIKQQIEAQSCGPVCSEDMRFGPYLRSEISLKSKTYKLGA